MSSEAREWRQRSGIRRLERIADLMFTFALLVSIADVALVTASYTAEVDTWDFIASDLSVYTSFALNFVVIAFYWRTHQKFFSHYIDTDGWHATLELMFLFAVVSMPFSDFILGQNGEGLMPIFYVCFEIFVAGVILWGSWTYATANNRLTEPDEVSADLRAAFQLEALVAALSAVVAAGLALISPAIWLSGFVIVPLMVRFLK